MSDWTHNKDQEAAKQQLAQEAMALIEQAEQLEAQEQWAKAAYLYQQAAEKLQRSGYAMHFISDLYSKATDCNNRAKPAKPTGSKFRGQQLPKPTLQQVESFQQPMKPSQKQVEALQHQALAMIQNAKNHEQEKRFGDAIEQYLSAVNLLTEAGWIPEQLEDIKQAILHLQQLMATGSRP